MPGHNGPPSRSMADVIYQGILRLPWPARGLLLRLLLRKYAYSHVGFQTRDADACLISFPKCGRTWVRMMLGKYLSRLKDLPEGSIDNIYTFTRGIPDLPTIATDHEDAAPGIQFKGPRRLQSDKSRYGDKKVVFIVRDLRDALVSYYMHLCRRDHMYQSNISSFVRDPRFGAPLFVRYHNIWAANRHRPCAFLLVRYEDLHQDAEGELTRLLHFLDLPVRPELVADTIRFSSFANLQQLEKKNAIWADRQTRPTDDPETLHVRKGKVGGFGAYLSPEDVAYLSAMIESELSPYFGYDPSGAIVRARSDAQAG